MHPDIDGHIAYEQSVFDALVAQNYLDLTALGSDLRIAQDYEQYLNNREVINAVMAANPDSAFTAGWIATFARVNDLGLNHVHVSDFFGGLVGYLDSVNKAGLGAAAANATVKHGSGSSILVEVRVASGAEVPGALSVFADQTNVTSDATGQTVQFVFNNNIDMGSFHLLGPNATGGDTGNDLSFGGENVENVFHASPGSGNDILIGGSTTDVIYGGSGWDFLDGGAGTDFLFGEDGGDILRGGLGTDYLYGGPGDDIYAFSRGDGVDRIIDETSGMVFRGDPNGFPGSGHYEQQAINAGADTLVFGAEISPADIRVRLYATNSLVVGIKDQPTISAWRRIILTTARPSTRSSLRM
jgi:Ca2+-binding RTX toxin-like protein